MTMKTRNHKPYTTGEIADLCHVTINAVKKWIAAGKLEAFRTPGGHYRVRRDDFKLFVDTYRMHLKEEIFKEKRKVLIIDDEPKILEYLKGVFESSAAMYEVETSLDGYEGLVKVGDFKPDLIILDIKMPLIDGFEVCRRLRNSEATKDIKILAMTAYDSTDVANIVQSGADDCLTKPISAKDFKSRVESIFES